MPGVDNLNKVLKSLEVSCDDVQYGFSSIGNQPIPADERILGTFKEKEGLTLIAPVTFFAETNIPHEGPFAKLTIEVHTSLSMVGLTAVLATQLTKNQVSANVYAAFFHDHIFVQYDLRHKAINAINQLKSDLISA